MFLFVCAHLVCVCAVVKALTKSQENAGLDRSYRGINLKLALLDASFCKHGRHKALCDY